MVLRMLADERGTGSRCERVEDPTGLASPT
jgi:hypothetical protein